MGAVGIFDIGFVDGPVEPLLVPPHLVDAVVMAAAVGDGDFVKFRVMQEGGGGRLTSGGSSVNADAGEVHFWVLSGGSLHPFNTIGEAGVFKVFVGDLLKILAAVISSKTIDLNDNKTAFGHFIFMAGPAAPSFGNEGTVWASVDVLDDGVFPPLLKITRSPDDSVDVVFVVAILADEALGELPVDFELWFVESSNEFFVRSTANFVDRGMINAGPFGEIVGFVGRE